ncbi:hypothetical protein ANAPRD1_01357 [Anaplasma phagocytophilum]|nr:hypothetical protein ANAPRD1_01357 [Anaplasma phagocytophilum]
MRPRACVCASVLVHACVSARGHAFVRVNTCVRACARVYVCACARASVCLCFLLNCASKKTNWMSLDSYKHKLIYY